MRVPTATTIRALIRFAAAHTVFAAVCLITTLPSPCSSQTPGPIRVAPGVFKIILGTPERLTPLSFPTAPPAIVGLRAMPDPIKPPIAAAEVGFKASPRGCVLTLPLAPDERVYGFGMQMKIVNAKGKRVWIKVSDAPNHDLGDSHAPVPFYVTTHGYGVLVDTARYATFYVGGLDPAGRTTTGGDSPNAGSATSADALYAARASGRGRMVVEIPVARGADIYLFTGPTILQAVERYNLFSGGGCLPPLWGLGIAYRGKSDFGADAAIALAKSLRDAHMPCDMWGLEPGWQSHSYSCSFMWDKNRFPDAPGFLRSMQDMGYRVNLWEHAFTHPTSPIYSQLSNLSGDYRVWGGLVPDFALPATRQIFAAYHGQTFAQAGVTAFKLDECDNQTLTQPWSFPELSSFPSGLDGEQMHSLFGRLYQQTMWDVYRKAHQRTYGLARASHALAAPLPFVMYSDTYDHRDYVRALVTSGFSGILWSPEVRDCKSVEELYRRVESAIFSPMPNINAWYLRNPPWMQIITDANNAGQRMADSAAVEANIRALFELRMQLIPYFYSSFVQYHLHGRPPFRQLVLDYPADPAVVNIDDEYMAGDALLVAPMFAGETGRNVYLPRGAWYDFYTHERFDGGRTITVEKAAEQIPLFVKDGSLLPLADPVEHVQRDTVFKIHCEVFGTAPAPFVLYEDDGESDAFDAGQYNRIYITYTAAGGGRAEHVGTWNGTRYDIGPFSVVDRGR